MHKKKFFVGMPVLKSLNVFSENERQFTGWASVETVDKDGELIPIADLEKAMNVWVKHGAPMTHNHTNRVIARGLNWERKEKDGKPGILITGEVFPELEASQHAWDEIKSGKITGLSVGGSMKYAETTKDGNGEYDILHGMEIYEIALVDNPANQESLLEEVNMFAKSLGNLESAAEYLEKAAENLREQAKAAPVQKPFAGYKNFDDCVSQNGSKGDPKAYCATIMRDVEGKAEKSVKKDEAETRNLTLASIWEEARDSGGSAATMQENFRREAHNARFSDEEIAQYLSGRAFPNVNLNPAATLGDGSREKDDGPCLHCSNCNQGFGGDMHAASEHNMRTGHAVEVKQSAKKESTFINNSPQMPTQEGAEYPAQKGVETMTDKVQVSKELPAPETGKDPKTPVEADTPNVLKALGDIVTTLKMLSDKIDKMGSAPSASAPVAPTAQKGVVTTTEEEGRTMPGLSSGQQVKLPKHPSDIGNEEDSEPASADQLPTDRSVEMLEKMAAEVTKEVVKKLKTLKKSSTPRAESGDENVHELAKGQSPDADLALKIAKGEAKTDWNQINGRFVEKREKEIARVLGRE